MPPRRRGHGDRLAARPRASASAARGGSSSRSADSSPRARRRPSAGRARPACASSSASSGPGSGYPRLRATSIAPRKRPPVSSIAWHISSRSAGSGSDLPWRARAAIDNGPCDRRPASVRSTSCRTGLSAGSRRAPAPGDPDRAERREQRAHRGVGEHQLASRREQRHRVLEVVHDRLEVGRRCRAAPSVRDRGQLRADRVERAPEVAELVAGQIERDVELAAAQPGQAALDHVDRPQHPLRQQRRHERRDERAR